MKNIALAESLHPGRTLLLLNGYAPGDGKAPLILPNTR